jgi:hypothetical protein
MEGGEGIIACAVGGLRWISIDFYKNRIRDASEWGVACYVVIKSVDYFDDHVIE